MTGAPQIHIVDDDASFRVAISRVLQVSGYEVVQYDSGPWFGRFVLLGYTWTLFHHTFGGIRHLIWDTGRGFGPSEREWLAAATLFASITCTVVLWVAGYFFVG